MTPRKPPAMRDLARVLSELRRTEPWGRRLSRHGVFRIWEEAVGGSVARVARPVAVRGSCLVVEVCDSAWLQELRLRSKDLLDKLNEALEGSDLGEIRFRLGAAGAQAEGEEGPSPSAGGGPFPQPFGIAEDDEKAIASALHGLADPELRGYAERLLVRARRRAAASRRAPEGRAEEGVDR